MNGLNITKKQKKKKKKNKNGMEVNVNGCMRISFTRQEESGAQQRIIDESSSPENYTTPEKSTIDFGEETTQKRNKLLYIYIF